MVLDNDFVISEDDIIVDEFIHRMLFGLKIHMPEAHSEILKNLTLLQLRIIRYLSANIQKTVKDVKDSLEIPNSTLTSALNSLEKRGIIRRKINSEDLRSYLLELTEQGVRIQEEHQKMDFRGAHRLLNCLDTEEEKRLFVKLLKKATDKL